jgi:hypothetical protein
MGRDLPHVSLHRQDIMYRMRQCAANTEAALANIRAQQGGTLLHPLPPAYCVPLARIQRNNHQTAPHAHQVKAC